MIEGMFDSGSLPVLERVVQFTSARQTALANDIANISTPYYKPRDLSTKEFQAELRRAIEQRREEGGALQLKNTQQVTFGEDELKARSQPSNQGILFHDQNNRDVDRLMQSVAENALTHMATLRLMNQEFSVLQMAIRERA
jgi:flagellar basal-body rod protein FlgB